jgi:hypothetical protein
MERLLQEKYGPDNLNFAPVVFPLPNIFSYTLGVVNFPSLLVGLDSQVPDLRLALAE